MTIKIDDLTLGQIKEIQQLTTGATAGQSGNSHPYKIGENYIIRTVTMIQIGKLEAVYNQELVLSDACWVACTGQFNEALRTGKLESVQPFIDNINVGRGSIVESTAWRHKLPREVITD